MFAQSKNPYETGVDKKAIENFSKGYISFLNTCKTEREVFNYSVERLEKAGFKLFDANVKYVSGDKVFFVNRGKAVSACLIGNDAISKGVHVVASHIDSPKIDLKLNPLYENSEFAMFKTHYYGGVKKYQWTAIPLALHGTIITKTKSIDIVVGEADGDIGFTITDLLPHLAQKQMQKKGNDIIEGENLQVIIGSIPDVNAEKDKVKAHILGLLKEKYGIEEEDLISSDLTFVPAFKAKSLGFDSSLIGGYGQDDRVCAYSSLESFLELKETKKTAFLFLVDREEIGSEGNTGMQSEFFYNTIFNIAKATQNITDYIDLQNVLAKSKCLSADVNAGYDPLYKDVFEEANASKMNHGVIISKHSGSRGKMGASDSGAEFKGYIRNILNDKGIAWQIGELGKVEAGGGGTVAKFLSNKNMDVIDVGVAIFSMHSPYEVSSKLDVYMSSLCYKAFYEA